MHIGVKITTSKEIAAHLRNGSCSENAFSLIVINSQKVCFHRVDWQLVSSVVMPLSCLVVYLSCSVAVSCSPSVKKLAQAHV